MLQPLLQLYNASQMQPQKYIKKQSKAKKKLKINNPLSQTRRDKVEI
jgi:hypothetical protein